MFRPFDSRLGGYLADGVWIVSGNHSDGYALSGEVRKGLLGIFPNRTAENQQSQRRNLLRVQTLRLRISIIACHQQHPAAPVGPAANLGGNHFHLPAQNPLRSARHKGPFSFKYRSAPFGLGGEGNPFHFHPAAFTVKQFPNGPGGGVVRLLSAVHSAEHRFQIFRLMAGQGNQVFHFHFRLGDGAGFVHAQHIHPGQGLDAVHILHQNLFPAQLQRRGRHGNGGQQVQPLGNHPHQGRHSAFHTIPEVQLQHGKFLVKQHQSHRNQGNAQHQNQLVQRTHHFGFAGFGIFLGLPGELAGKSLRPHRRQLHPAPSRHYNAAGAQNVPGHMGNSFGFSGNQGFIQP